MANSDFTTKSHTLVQSRLLPSDNNSNFPVTTSEYLGGGLKSVVANRPTSSFLEDGENTFRDRIQPSRRELGMIVYSNEDEAYYTLLDREVYEVTVSDGSLTTASTDTFVIQDSSNDELFAFTPDLNVTLGENLENLNTQINADPGLSSIIVSSFDSNSPSTVAIAILDENTYQFIATSPSRFSAGTARGPLENRNLYDVDWMEFVGGLQSVEGDTGFPAVTSVTGLEFLASGSTNTVTVTQDPSTGIATVALVIGTVDEGADATRAVELWHVGLDFNAGELAYLQDDLNIGGRFIDKLYIALTPSGPNRTDSEGNIIGPQDPRTTEDVHWKLIGTDAEQVTFDNTTANLPGSPETVQDAIEDLRDNTVNSISAGNGLITNIGANDANEDIVSTGSIRVRLANTDSGTESGLEITPNSDTSGDPKGLAVRFPSDSATSGTSTEVARSDHTHSGSDIFGDFGTSTDGTFLDNTGNFSTPDVNELDGFSTTATDAVNFLDQTGNFSTPDVGDLTGYGTSTDGTFLDNTGNFSAIEDPGTLFADSTDASSGTPNYLIDKLVSRDSSVTIEVNSNETDKVNLEVDLSSISSDASTFILGARVTDFGLNARSLQVSWFQQ